MFQNDSLKAKARKINCTLLFGDDFLNTLQKEDDL